jgi:hypothetical protein
MNPENTFAYLIAVEDYTEDKGLHSLPQSFNNVSELYKILRSPLVGIPVKTNIDKSINPTDKTGLLKDIKKLIEADGAKTLIVYYAGHGVLDDDGKHYLTLTNSTLEGINIDGLGIDDLSKAWEKKKNLNVILILDSCFSENAFDNFKARNYLLMASSAKNRTSKYPVKADFSAFTNEIINTMKNGVDIDSKTLTWKNIFQQVKQKLKEKNFPAPKISAQNEVESMEACENRFNTKEVSLEDQWIKVIREDYGKADPKFQEYVVGILNAGGPQVIKKLSELLLNVFPYPIAFYLNALFEKNVEINAFFKFYESVIQFLCIVDFIHYEGLSRKNKFKPDNRFRTHLMDFAEPDHNYNLVTLQLISEGLINNNAKRFLVGFDFFNPEFQEVIENLEKERNSKESRINVVKVLIFKLVKHLHFFLNYKLLSVNNVNLNYRKYNPMEFNHNVSLLHGNYQSEYEIWSRPSETWQKAFVKNREAKNSRSVIFMKCNGENMGEYLNLWPLIIDRNVLKPKATTPEIYLFNGIANDDNYSYLKLGETNIEKRTLYNELEALDLSGKLERFKEILRT